MQQGHDFVRCEWARRVGFVRENPLTDQTLKVHLVRALHLDGSFKGSWVDETSKVILRMAGVSGGCSCGGGWVSMVRREREEKIGVQRRFQMMVDVVFT